MSGLRRFFTDGDISDRVIFSKDEYLHAVKVLRIKVGDEIIVCNGSDKEYVAIVDKIGKEDFSCHVVSETVCEKEPSCHVALCCGFLKGDKTELVVREAVELGVNEIAVFDSEFSSAYISDNKLARLNKVCVEAAKQCGRSRVVKVDYYPCLEEVLAKYREYENKLFACEFDNGQRQKAEVKDGRVAVVVGSEGGFSKKESELALSYGFNCVSLGNRILRADTASTVLLSLVFFQKGELQ